VIVLLISVLLAASEQVPEPQTVPNATEATEAAEEGTILARIGESVLTVEQYYILRRNYDSQEEPADPAVIIENWIQQQIIAIEAEKLGLTDKDIVKASLSELEFLYSLNRAQLLFEAWAAEIADQVEIPERQVRSYFKKHKDEYNYSVKVSQIMVTDAITAQYIQSQLNNGADFTALAEQYTLDQLKGQPSDFIGRGSGQLTLAMEDAIFCLEPGQITEPIEIAEGYIFIYKLHEKVKTRKETGFEEVRDAIERPMAYEAAQSLYEEKLDSLRLKARDDVSIYFENLLFFDKEER